MNVAPLVGHSLLRLWVLGLESRERASTPAEVEALADLLRESLDAGAVGLSTSMSDIDHAAFGFAGARRSGFGFWRGR